MHIFFYVRGVQHQVNIFLTLAQAQFWVWERKDLKTKKKFKTLVQGALRPSVLGCYEYVFPEECLSEVLAVFGFTNEPKDFRTSMLRKILRCQKIPKKYFSEAKKIETNIMLNDSCRGLSNLVVPGCGNGLIGMKKDKRGDMFGYEQEAL